MSKDDMQPSGEWVPTPIDQALSGLEMSIHLAPGELVAGAIVLMKTILPDGQVALRQTMMGLDWLTEIGILQQAANDAAEPMSLKALWSQMRGDS